MELEALEEKRRRVSERADSVFKKRALVDTEEHNKVLRETIHKQRLLLATTTSYISSFLVRLRVKLICSIVPPTDMTVMATARARLQPFRVIHPAWTRSIGKTCYDAGD